MVTGGTSQTNMKNIAVFTVADSKADKQFEMFSRTFLNFHGARKDRPAEVDLVRFSDKEIREASDPHIMLRATPYFTRLLFDRGYDLVIKMDSDQLILGDMSYIWNSRDYDVGTVYNLNRIDPTMYPFVQGWGILPKEYYNIGLVAIRSREFVNHWWQLCNTPYFSRFQYGDQDIYNILCHYGNYKVKCFDEPRDDYRAWHGLIAKGEGRRMVVRDGKVILPRGEDHYPEADTEIKAYHWAGGFNEQKMNYRMHFSEEVINFIDDILK